MINIPIVSESIKQARTNLANNPKGILSLGDRRRIWISMNDPDNFEVSYLNRTQLKVVCVNHVKPIWSHILPANPGIDRMLQLTHSLMKKSVDPGAAEDEAFYFFQDLSTSVESNAVTNPALMVADAATSMVISACYRNPDYDTVDNDIDDEELAPDSYETSYTCASAAA
ncbi:Imm5 family immunity protein, partial [Actinomyces viscosus]